MKFVVVVLVVYIRFTFGAPTMPMKRLPNYGVGKCLSSPSGLSFIGSGYNIIRGNPDGKEIKNGGVDPGLLPAKRVLEISYHKGRKSDNNKYNVPDQIRYVDRDSCVQTSKHSIITDTKSYQKELSESVKVSAGYDSSVFSAAFSASSSYKSMDKATSKDKNIFFEEKTVCMKGNAAYFYNQLQQGKFSVSREFAAAVCHLPQNYTEKEYLEFIETWGTDVVIAADMGTKNTIRRESSTTEFLEYAMINYADSVSASVGFGGASASFSVNVGSLSESMKAGSKFGRNQVKFKFGTHELPEPIAIKLVSITEMFDKKMIKAYIKHKTQSCDFAETSLRKLKNNLVNILRRYGIILDVHFPQENGVSIPILWPRGTYALPAPNCGKCPENKDFTWKEGYKYQDSADKDNENTRSSGNHLCIMEIPWYNSKAKDAKQRFCVKTEETSSHLPWPKGSYCINKKGQCPIGFKEGSIQWKDEVNQNRNSRSGVLPDGYLISRGPAVTVFDYCCRSDEFPSNPIYLPTKKPFLLYKASDGICQRVIGMNVREEWFYYDTRDGDKEYVIVKGTIPYSIYNKNIKLFYCYYSPSM